jgi:MFS family permease
VLVAKYGRKTLLGGLIVMAIGVLGLEEALHTGGDALSAWALAPGLFGLGLGIGLMIAPFFDIVLAGVEEHELGSASGTMNANQQLGGSIGVAVLGTVFFSVADHHAGSGAASAFHSGISSVLWVQLGLIVVTFALAFLLPKRAREEGAEAAAAVPTTAVPA